MTDDEAEIRALIAAQFDAVGWDRESEADWLQFYRGFLPGARLFNSQRPAKSHSPFDFATRLDELRDGGTLEAFSERGAGCHVWIVGKVAVALAGCEMTENGTEITRDVSALLLVRNDDGWRIAAQAWDYVDDIGEAFAAAGLPSGDETAA